MNTIFLAILILMTRALSKDSDRNTPSSSHSDSLKRRPSNITEFKLPRIIPDTPQSGVWHGQLLSMHGKAYQTVFDFSFNANKKIEGVWIINWPRYYEDIKYGEIPDSIDFRKYTDPSDTLSISGFAINDSIYFQTDPEPTSVKHFYDFRRKYCFSAKCIKYSKHGEASMLLGTFIDSSIHDDGPMFFGTFLVRK